MSMDYFTVKWIHILSSTLLLGTGLGIAFFMWMAHRTRDARAIATTARMVVIADSVFTAPAVAIQLVTGLWMVHALHMPFGTFWVEMSLILFFVTGACWLPVVWLQIRARDLARQAVVAGDPLPTVYGRVMRWWFWLGWPAFISVIVIFWLMVHKPG
ncbi:MAG TPA: DUF2269 domain-containing protein [Rhodanobacteraceae bacterium]|nr:DUF2269 domain-containing protein [Rhodanobacteraceae bacterium]